MYYNKCLEAMIAKFTEVEVSYGEAKELLTAYSECLNGTYINYARLSDILSTKTSFDLLTKYVSVINKVPYRNAIKVVRDLKKTYRMSYSDLLLSTMHREIEEVLN